MTLIVKIMGAEDAPDDDTRKTFKLLTGVVGCEFVRSVFASDRAYAHIEYVGGEVVEVELTGNTYVMNENGKTIASFGIANYASVEQVRSEINQVA